MKYRILALFLACLTMAGLLAGCSKPAETDSDSEAEGPQYAYQTTFTPLDLTEQKVQYINSMCLSGDAMYLAANCVVGQEESIDPETNEPYLDDNQEPVMYDVYETRILAMNLDTQEVRQLDGYTPSEIPEGMEGSVNISGITPGADGTIWICEDMYTYYYDLPENFDSTSDDMWNYYVEGGNSTKYIQLDAEGQVLQTKPFQVENVSLSGMAIDGEGNFYGSDWQNLYLFNDDGTVAATIPVENGINSLIRLGDGKVYVNMYLQKEEEYYNALVPVDTAAKALGEEEIRIPNNAYQVYPGDENYFFYYNYNGTIYGYKKDVENGERLFAWIDCDLNENDIQQFSIRADGSVLAMEGRYNETTSEQEYNLVTIRQVDASTLPEQVELTLACMYLDWDLRNEIVEFNRQKNGIRVNVADYSQYNTEDDYTAGIQKLNTEILSGKVPDILVTDSLPIKQFTAKGLLLDLYPLIDADEELSREDLMTHFFDTIAEDGKLYQIVDSFAIDSVAGRASVVGDRTSWTLQDLMDAKASMGDNVSIFGEYDTKSGVLYSCLSHAIDGFIDWEARTCSFDSQEFIDMLNFANQFPKEFNYEDYDWETSESEFARIHNGKQMLTRAYIYSLSDIQYQSLYFDGDVAFVGYPTTGSTGSTFTFSTGLAISAACQHPDEAWKFVRTFLTEDYQTKEYMYELPTNKHSFDAYAEQAMKQEYYTDPETGEEKPVSTGGIGFGDGEMIELYAITQEEMDLFMKLYESCGGVTSYNENISNIVNEETAAFFDGQKTAEETASLIQNRVSLYIQEQK